MPQPVGLLRGVNIPWITDGGTPRYDGYVDAFVRARSEGYQLCRVWAAPWEVSRGGSVEDYVESRVTHFARLAFEAKRLGIRLMPCIHSHVEFLEVDILREVEDPRNGWLGSPLSTTRGGPFARPDEFLGSTSISSQIIERLLRSRGADSIVAIEALNEIDQLEGYRLVDAAQWFASLSRLFDTPILVSAAEPWNSLLLAATADQRIASCHFHGWPVGGVREVAAAVEQLARHARLSTIWTEVSNDSQAPPQDQDERDRLERTCHIVAAASHGPAYPWWWLEASGLSQVSRPPQPLGATPLRSIFMRNVRRRAAWARLARCVLILWFPSAAALHFRIARATSRRRLSQDDR